MRTASFIVTNYSTKARTASSIVTSYAKAGASIDTLGRTQTRTRHALREPSSAEFQLHWHETALLPATYCGLCPTLPWSRRERWDTSGTSNATNTRDTRDTTNARDTSHQAWLAR